MLPGGSLIAKDMCPLLGLEEQLEAAAGFKHAAFMAERIALGLAPEPPPPKRETRRDSDSSESRSDSTD